MIKSFRKLKQDVGCYEVTSVNLRSGKLNQFTYQIKEINGKEYIKKHSHYEDNTFAMGFRQPRDYLNHANRLMFESFDVAKLEKYPELD